MGSPTGKHNYSSKRMENNRQDIDIFNNKQGERNPFGSRMDEISHISKIDDPINNSSDKF